MIVEVCVVNAFTDAPEGGNPAAIVLDADNLAESQMQEIAAKVGLSETAFVSKSKLADFRFDFFTPNRRIAHCGHATIAAFNLLLEQRLLDKNHSSKETVDGRREIFIRNGKVYMEQTAPTYARPEEMNVSQSDILTSLGITESMVAQEALVVNTGNSFIVLEVNSSETLESIKPRHESIKAISDKLDLIGYYIFARDILDADATTRMFAPRYAIPEEAATGMAAGPLVSYLYDKLKMHKTSYLIQQGFFMEAISKSYIHGDLELVGDNIKKVYIGGNAFTKSRIEINI